MESKTEGTIWKGIENCVRNWSQKWPCILFGAIYRENKQCYANHLTSRWPRSNHHHSLTEAAKWDEGEKKTQESKAQTFSRSKPIKASWAKKADQPFGPNQAQASRSKDHQPSVWPNRCRWFWRQPKNRSQNTFQCGGLYNRIGGVEGSQGWGRRQTSKALTFTCIVTGMVTNTHIWTCYLYTIMTLTLQYIYDWYGR